MSISFNLVPRAEPDLVNKRNLSTGENGKFHVELRKNRAQGDLLAGRGGVYPWYDNFRVRRDSVATLFDRLNLTGSCGSIADTRFSCEGGDVPCNGID